MITVEDYNSVMNEYRMSVFTHEINTALITDEYDFDGIKYDFCIVSRETTGTNEYTYTFEIVHELWWGLYYIYDNDNVFVSDATVSLSDGVLTVVTDKPSIKLFLKIQKDIGYDLRMMTWDIVEMNLEGYGGRFYFEILDGTEPDPTIEVGALGYSEVSVYYDDEKSLYYFDFSLSSYVIRMGVTSFEAYYKNCQLLIDVFETAPFNITLDTNELALGKSNLITLKYPSFSTDTSSYKDAILSYKNTKTPIKLSEKYSGAAGSKYPVDLTGIYDLNKLEIDLLVLNPLTKKKWTLPCTIYNVNTRGKFIAECGNDGAGVIQIGLNFQLNSNVTITHDLHIIGNGKTINLNGYGLILNTGIKVTIENVNFINGDTSILQKANTNLTLVDCSFTNSVSSNHENRGSCILCDIDQDSLSVTNDFTTELIRVKFIDNQSCILHGGQLTVTDCKLHNIDLDYIDKHNPAFLYQVDGNAIINNSTFDIDYGTDYTLCENHESIGLAQCLIQCGQTAKINNSDYEDLQTNDCLPFFNYPYNNKSHVFAKYYYSKISACVFTSPTVNNEDVSACHSVTGVNQVFKNNIQITRSSDNTENTIRKIIWED